MASELASPVASTRATGPTPDAPPRTWMTVCVLWLLAVGLYAPMIGWGVPQATAADRARTFATDEILPLEAVGEMHNTFVVSKPSRNYGYPWWHYFVAASAQSPYVAYLWLSGKMKTPTPEYPFGMSDPVGALRRLTLIGRAVSVLMGAGIAVAAYYFSSILWGHMAGVIASLLTMLNYLMFYYSRTGNLDVPAFFWISLGLVIFARIMADGLTAGRAVWLGIFAGLAMATKDQALVIFLPLGCLLLLPRLIKTPEPRWRPILCGLAASIVAYVIATGMIVDPQRHLTHVEALLFDQDRITRGSAYWPPHPRTLAGTLALVGDYAQGLVAVYSPPLLLASVAGALLAWRSSPRWLVLLLPMLALLLMVFWPTGIVVRRYLLPFALILSSFAAYALMAVRSSRLRPLWIPLTVLVCGWQLLIGADLTYAQFHDTRYAAADWFKREAKTGDRVEYFGTAQAIPHLAADITSRHVAGRINWVGEFGHGPRVLDYLIKEGPEYVVIVPDWTSQPGMERSADCPAEVYAALENGSAGYELAAYFPSRSFPGNWRVRPRLDNPSVCPPVRIFARHDVLKRIKLNSTKATL